MDYSKDYNNLPDMEPKREGFAQEVEAGRLARRLKDKKCKYDSKSEAVHECVLCGDGLCSFCGYVIGNRHYCNECYLEKGVER